MALNKWLGIGRLTADPELRQTPQGVSVCRFNIAIDRAYKSGTERKADFIPVVVWRGTAEFIAKYFGKGEPIQVEGQLQTHTYEKQDGTKQFVMEVIADNVSFVEGAAKNNSQSDETADDYEEEFADLGQADDDDDLPF